MTVSPVGLRHLRRMAERKDLLRAIQQTADEVR